MRLVHILTIVLFFFPSLLIAQVSDRAINIGKALGYDEELKLIVVNDEFPLAIYTSYHFNTKNTQEIRSSENLGIYSSKEKALEVAKNNIDSYFEYLAIYYQKLTGKI